MSTLPEIESKMAFHRAEMQHHALAFCKLVAHIYDNQTWREGDCNGFRQYMEMRWGIKKDGAYDMAKIGRELSVISDSDMNAHQLLALANVKPEIRPAVIDALSTLPTDKITASAINRLADVVEVAITTGAVEVDEGMQIQLNQLQALEAGVLLELVESRKRQLDHVSGKNPPIFSQNGLSLREALETAHAQNLPPTALSTLKIYDKAGGGKRIVIEISKLEALVTA